MSVRTMRPFAYHVPATLGELTALLGELGPDAQLIAGGTDLVPKLKGQVLRTGHVVSLKAVRELDFIEFDPQNGLRFGATTTLRALEAHPAVREHYPALFQGCSSIASTQIRNKATVVGNICNAVPSADSAPALLVLGAKVKILSADGERLVPAEEFFTGVCKTVLRPGELVAEVQLPAPLPESRSIYYKYTVRRALDLAMVGVAAMVQLEGQTIREVKIGLGAVAVTPRRAANAEAMLRGQVLNEALIERAAAAASEQDCAPITDMRATEAYRREMVRVLTRDAVRACAGLKVY